MGWNNTLWCVAENICLGAERCFTMNIMIMKTLCGIQNFVDFLVRVHQQSFTVGMEVKVSFLIIYLNK